MSARLVYELPLDHPYLRQRPYIIHVAGFWSVRWRDFLSVKQDIDFKTEQEARRKAAEIEAGMRYVPKDLLDDVCTSFEEAEMEWLS